MQLAYFDEIKHILHLCYIFRFNETNLCLNNFNLIHIGIPHVYCTNKT